jgi:hypothetical protein
MTETPRQRFIRNHDENVRIMRAAAVREREAGNTEAAQQITDIADAWEQVGDKAKELEGE